VVASTPVPFLRALGELRFNPLHRGAVVASRKERLRTRSRPRVSIPFIAGQWSLLSDEAQKLFRLYQFQSPSSRGSGRFGRRIRHPPVPGPRFNPLHRGAVVASLDAFAVFAFSETCFNPLHRGAVVASKRSRE